MILAVLGVVGSVISTVAYWRISPPQTRIVQGLTLLTSSAVICVLHVRRSRPSAALADALFLLVLPPAAAMMWAMDAVRALQGAHWVPYEPNKLGALTVAIIAPPHWWTGLVAILLFVGSALVHHALMPEAIRGHMVSGEPLGIIAYGSFALVLLVFRQRSQALREALESARAEKLALARLARVALSLRDLANTPLQTLELVRRALLTARPVLTTQAHRMAHALERLKRLDDILRPYEDTVACDEAARVKRGARGVAWRESAALRPGSRAARRSV
jgi:hypothetical protein